MFHCAIGIVSNWDSDGRIAQWAYLNRISHLAAGRVNEEPTRGGHTIMLELIVLGALVGSGKIVLATELVFAVLAFERQEIDEVTELSGTLVSYGEESGFVGCSHACGIGIRVTQARHPRRRLIYALAQVDAQASLPSPLTLRKKALALRQQPRTFLPLRERYVQHL